MFAHLRFFAFLAGGAIVVMMIAGAIGEYLESSQPQQMKAGQQVPGKGFIAVYMTLFVIFCAAMVPLILRFFTHMQGIMGNSELGMVKFIQGHERTITYAVWGVMVVVLLFVMPAVLREGGIVGGVLSGRRRRRSIPDLSSSQKTS